MNQRRAPARSSSRRCLDQRVPSRCSSTVTASSAAAPSKAAPGRDQDVEEAVVLEAVLAGVPDGVVQPGRALERRLAVQRRVDPPASVRARREAPRPPDRRCGTSAAARPRRPRRRPPASRLGGRIGGQLDEDRARRRPRARRGAATTRRALPARSSRSRSAISSPARSSPSRRHEPDRAGELPGAAGTTTDSGIADAAHQRQVGVPEHEAADQLGAVLGRAGAVRRRRLVERGVAGREDRGVVDQTAPTRQSSGTGLT